MTRENLRMTARSSIAELDAQVAGQTVPRSFLTLASERPDFPLLHSMKEGGGWNSWTTSEVRALTADVAAGLLADGVATGERVLLMMRNRPDFHWLDLGAQFVRATPVSIYNSSSPEEIQYLAGHAEARIAVVEDESFLTRLLKVRDELPRLEKIYVIDPPDGVLPDGVAPADELLSHGSADLDELAAATEPDDLATLIYTSGTTGPPKGVMLTQYNIVFTVASTFETMANPDAVGWRVV